PGRALGVGSDQRGELVELFRRERYTGDVHLGGRAIGLGDGDVRTHLVVDGNSAVWEPEVVEGGEQRAAGARWGSRTGRQPSRRDGAGQLGSLAARVRPEDSRALDLAATRGRAGLESAVEARIGGDGQDHAITTSMPRADSAAENCGS